MTHNPAALDVVRAQRDRAARFVCPGCLGDLAERGRSLACTGCRAEFAVLDSGYTDFAGPDVRWREWWLRSPEEGARWEAEEAPREEAFQASGARRLVLPLLDRLGYRPVDTSVLSAGCGLAMDVEVLHDAGYDAWGIDCGSRVEHWSARQMPDRLARADAAKLPFPDRSFDFVMALDVLEHIGALGDTTRVTPDCEERRRETMRSLLRVTKPGGYLLLSGVNRRFPVDSFHTQESRWLRIHSPWEPFSLSYGDYVRLTRSTGYAIRAQPLPLRGFFSFQHLGRKALARPFIPIIDWLLGGLPPAFYGSWLSFFILVLVQRRAVTSPLEGKPLR